MPKTMTMARRRQCLKTAARVTVGILFLWVALPGRLAALPNAAKSEALASTASQRPLSFTDIARRAMPAVVNISATQGLVPSPMPEPFSEEDPLEEFFRRFFGERVPPAEQQNLGSGFIIGADGYIITNNHVIANAKQITVRLAQPRNDEFRATVVGIDELTDLALIKIAATYPLPTIPMGNSASLSIGEWVIAIGNPFGLEQTVTAGIVSGKGRVIGAGPYDDFIQTDASINPGNSGGPLLNLRGEAVGINTVILSQAGGNIGIGFAIPIDFVKSVVAQLKTTGKVRRGWLGVALQAVTPDIAGFFGLDEPRGALITGIDKGAPAEAAGIKRGDIITSFNGIPIKESHALPAMVARVPVGERAEVGVIRDGRERIFTVTIGELPSRSPARAQRDVRRMERWGMTVTGISPDLVRQFRLESGQEGVVVIAIERDGSAARAGIQMGDVIEEVNRQPIRSLEDFDRVIKTAKDRDRILLLIRRGDSRSFLVVQSENSISRADEELMLAAEY
jgi:serine protease Do